MKTFKNKTIFFILALLITSCVPDSLTKFKEDSVEREKVEAMPDVTFKDSDGNVIDASDLTPPTSITYQSTTFTTGSAQELYPSGNLYDLELSDGNLKTNAEENYNPRYTTVPALPAGLSINSKTGVITANSTTPIAKVAYTIILTYRDPSTLSDTTLSANATLGLQTEIPDDFHVSFGATSSNRKMGLILEDNSAFSSPTTQIISPDNAAGSITLVDEDERVFIDLNPGVSFKTGDFVDNGTVYILPESTISGVEFYFPTNTTVDLTVFSSDSNAVDPSLNEITYTISPSLPVGLSLSDTNADGVIDSITGTVSSAQAKTTYTLSAVNNVSTKTYKFNLSISEAPELLSYSNLRLLRLNSTTGFEVGGYISSSPIAPSSDFGKGIIRFIADDYVVVEVNDQDGFTKNQLVDNSENFISTASYITEDIETVSSAITLSPGEGASFSNYLDMSKGFIVCQLSLAKATIVKITNDTLFVLQSRTSSGNFSGSFSAAGAINSSNTLCDTNNPLTVASGTITSVWAPSMNLSLSGDVGFKKGLDIISNNSVSGYLATFSSTTDTGEINLHSAGTINIGDAISPTKPYSASAITATAVSVNFKIDLEVGKKAILKPFLFKGDDLYFSVSPSLPDGLTLDTSSGIISGTPTKSNQNTAYTITASNIINSVQISLNLQINDYFELHNLTENASSYILHRAGEANVGNKCRVNKNDILDYVNGSGDEDIINIDCYLEGGESDLYFEGLKLQSTAGTGLCEVIRYKPFSFYQYRPVKSAPTGFSIVEKNECASPSPSKGTIYKGALELTGLTEEDLCAYSDKDFNCDEGQFSLAVYEITDNAGSCTYTVTENKLIKCGGNRRECLRGPIRDVLSDSQIDDFGFTSMSYNAVNGFFYGSDNGTFTISSPASKGYSSNRSIANYTNSNSCNDGNTLLYNKGWASHPTIASTDITLLNDPFKGASPFYEFECLDNASDPKARIRLMVRDWDRTFIPGITDGLDEIIPTKMDAAISFNQFYDWDDIGSPTYNSCDDTPTTPSLGASVSIGNVTGTQDTYDLSGTNFLTTLSNGMKVTINGSDEVIIKKVLSDTEATVVNPLPNDYTNDPAVKEPIFAFPGDDL